MRGSRIGGRAGRALGFLALLVLVLRPLAESADGGWRKALEDEFGFLEAEEMQFSRNTSVASSGSGGPESRFGPTRQAGGAAVSPTPRTPRSD